VTPDQFLHHCKRICHVGPAGAWERIKRHGFHTAEQLIQAATLDPETQAELLSTPRRESVHLWVDGEEIVLRDQAPLLARKDLSSVLGDGIDTAAWIQMLNRRVYFFTDEVPMRKLLNKYVERDGAQDVIWLSPLRLFRAADGRIELAGQNAGAIAHRSGPQKTLKTFLPIARFPDRRPIEVTVVDGLEDASAVVRAERFLADGSRVDLPV
jgi:hypothetical protein